MSVQQPARFPGLEIDDDDGAFAAIGDEGNVRGGVDANIVQVRFRRGDIFTERNRLHHLVRVQVHFHELGPAFLDFLHLRGGGIEDPKIVLVIDHDALDTDEMRTGGAGLVPFVVRKGFRFAVNDLCDGEEMIVGPIREVHEDASGFLRNADAGDLLIVEAGDLDQLARPAVNDGSAESDGDEKEAYAHAWNTRECTRSDWSAPDHVRR